MFTCDKGSELYYRDQEKNKKERERFIIEMWFR